MTAATKQPGAFRRLFRGETSFDFAGRWRRWFVISGTVIIIGLASLGIRGLNFSIDFKGGTIWTVSSNASVATVRAAVGAAVPGFGQSTVQVLTNSLTHKRTVQVEAAAKVTGNQSEVAAVTDALAKVAHVSPNQVSLSDVGPSWGSVITDKAIEAVIVFLIVVSIYIWLRFEGKMAVAALTALVHDILVTVGIYSLSGFQVSPDTVIAFLTILGYSLYDTIVVFDRVQENTRGLASSNRLTYSDTVNISMNQVLARSLNTSLVAILPILSILVVGAWILGATALEDFGLALVVGLTTGAYSSIFVASPLLALMKEREPRYSEIRRRLGSGPRRKLTPVAVAGSGGEFPVAATSPRNSRKGLSARAARDDDGLAVSGGFEDDDPDERGSVAGGGGEAQSIPLRNPPRPATNVPPRPRKKGRRG